MNKLRYTIALSFMMISGLAAFGQKDFSANTPQKAAEVFKNCMEYAGAEYIPIYKEWLTRVEVKTVAVTSSETYDKLNTIHLRNKCNQDLSYQNLNFDQSTFNPLKYLLDFETNVKLTYRIEGTDKVLIIHPKK